MAVLRVINNTPAIVTIADVGVIIPASGDDTYTDPRLVRDIAASQSLRVLITAGTLKVNDGVVDIATAEADGFLLSFIVSGGSNAMIPADTLLIIDDREISIADLVALDSTAIATATINGQPYAGWNLPNGVQTRRQIAVPIPPTIDNTFNPSLRLSLVAPAASLPPGNITIQTEITYRASPSIAGNAVAYGLTQNTVIAIPATGVAQNAVVKELIPFPVASVLPVSGVAMLSIARLGAAPGDTYTGNVILLAVVFGFRRKVGP